MKNIYIYIHIYIYIYIYIYIMFGQKYMLVNKFYRFFKKIL